MSLELYEMKVPENNETVRVVSLRSLLLELRKMSVSTDRNEKVVLASLERMLMFGVGELNKKEYEQEEGEESVEVPTPPEPAKAVPEQPVEVEVPRPVLEEHKQKPPTPVQPKKIELEDDEFPLR